MELPEEGLSRMQLARSFFLVARTLQLLQDLRKNSFLVLAISLSLGLQSAVILVLPWPLQKIIDHAANGPAHLIPSEAKDSLPAFIFLTFRDIFTSSSFNFLAGNIMLIALLYGDRKSVV